MFCPMPHALLLHGAEDERSHMSSPGSKRDRGRDDEAAREAAMDAEFDRERQRQRAMLAERERQQEREYQRRLDVWERHERLVVAGIVQRQPHTCMHLMCCICLFAVALQRPWNLQAVYVACYCHDAAMWVPGIACM